MSISSGSSVPFSSSSDSSAMAHTGKPSSAGSGSICFRAARWPFQRPRGIRRRCGAHATPTNRPRLVFVAEVLTARAAHSAEDSRRHALFMTTSSNEPMRTDRARATLACAWMQVFKLRKTARSQGCKYDVLYGGMKHSHDVREGGLHGSQGGLAGVDAGHVSEKGPRLSFLARAQHVVHSGRELRDRGRRGPAVLRCDVASMLWQGLLRKDGICLASVHDLHQHAHRATVRAESDRECRGLSRVAVAWLA